MFRLEERTAMVTGASRGIGTSIAEKLAAQGARTVVAARSADRLAELAAQINDAGGDAHALTLDLSQPETLAECVGDLPEPSQEIDILVNNAGITDDNLLLRMSLEQWEKVIRTNLTGVYALTKAVVRGMMRRRFGRVISISSIVGLMGNPGQTNYAASKAGMIGFSKSLARELGSRGITANVVAPGYVETVMTEGLSEEVRKSMSESISLRRFGAPDDIAAAVVYLASDEAGYVTGEVLNVSGGLYM